MPTRAEPWQRAGMPLLIALLAFAPLFRAANRPLPLLVLELGALILLALLFWHPGRLRELPRGLLLLGAALLALPLVHLMPIPMGLWESLPGRETYAAVLGLVTAEGSAGWRTLTLMPTQTEAALYQALPVVAVFAATYLLSVEQVKRLVLVLLAIAGLQAALGLMQFGAGPHSPLFFGNPFAGRSAAGTYANRDHLAGLLEMVFPVALALFVAHVGHGGRRQSRRRSRWRRRLEFMATVKGHNAAIYGALTVLLILGLVFTRSRAGVGLAMVGLFIALLAFARRLGGSNVYGTLGTVAAVVLVLAAEVGLAPVLDRFAKDPLADARWSIFGSSMDGIGSFFPLGAGAGTYPHLYPAFQPVELGRHFVNHAHNDFIEALFEAGLPVLLLMAFGVFLYFRQWLRVWVGGKWGEFRFIQVGAGIGLLLILLHSLVDFNMQIPANALFAAFLLAVFMKPYKEQSRGRRGSRKPTRVMEQAGSARDDADAEAAVKENTPPAPAPAAPPAEPLADEDNPFLKSSRQP